MKKFIIVLIILNLLIILNFAYSQNKGYKKLITIKDDGGFTRNPYFLEITVEDDNLKKDDNIILIDPKTQKEVPIYILEKSDKKVKFRCEVALNKNEEKQYELRFGTETKASETQIIDYSYPNFIGTEFYGISFEKIYIVGLKESDIKVENKEGKTLFEGKIKYGQYKRIDLTSPQVFHIVSNGPILVTVSSIGLQNSNSPQDKSDDDLTYLIGSEGFLFTPSDLFVTSFSDSNSVLIEDAGGELIFKGDLNKGDLINKTLKHPSLVYYKTKDPVLLIYGKFDDSPFFPLIPYKSNFYGLTFGDLKVYSLDDDLKYKINLLNSKKTFDGTLKKFDISSIETLVEPFLINFNKNLYLYLLGKSSNFGGEQILNKIGNSFDKDFSFLTGKISTKYSTGHKRVVYVLSLYDNNEITLEDITLGKINRITLQKMGIYQYETENSLSKIKVSSIYDCLVFETSNHINREIFYNVSPVKDSSIIVTLGKTEPITTGTKPPTDGTKPPVIDKPKVEIPQGIINIILWEFSLIKDRLFGFINSFKVVFPFFKNINLGSIKLPQFFDKINSYLPPFLQGINFILIIVLIILLVILVFIMIRKRKSKPQLEEVEEIEISKELVEPKIEKKTEIGFKEEEVAKEEEIIKPIELEEIKEKETPMEEVKPTEELIELKEEKDEEKVEMKELIPKPAITIEEKATEAIPTTYTTRKTVDTSIFKGKVVLDRKALMKLLELDLFPFLDEAYITSKVANELPVKYRTSEKIKAIELSKFEESMAEDLGKRVGGSKETGEAIALALKLKIDKCIVGEKFNKIFQNINIYSFENFG